MNPTISTLIRPFAPIVAAGTAAIALALPAAASAAPPATFAVSVVEGHVSIDSLSSTAAMHVHVMRTDENTIRVTDPGATIQTGDHCLNVQDDDTVDCDITGLTLDSVHFEGSPLGDSLTFEAGWTLPVKANGWGGNDDLSGAAGGDELRGGDGNDTLRGGAARDIVAGENGNDAVAGGAGDDDVAGGAGADRIFGGLGRDTLRGNAGADAIYAKGDAASGADRVFGGLGTDRATLDRNVDTSNSVERRTF